MLPLTPEAMELFNASVLQRSGVRYGAVVGKAETPSLHATLHAKIDPAARVTQALYSALHRLVQVAPVRVSPQLSPAQARVLRGAYRALPSPVANDGIVPTLSQAWGEVIHAAVADHLDVLGHFRDAEHHPPHVDWLVSGSDCDRRRFEGLWADVAQLLVPEAATRQRPRRASAGPRAKKARGRKKTRQRRGAACAAEGPRARESRLVLREAFVRRQGRMRRQSGRLRRGDEVHEQLDEALGGLAVWMVADALDSPPSHRIRLPRAGRERRPGGSRRPPATHSSARSPGVRKWIAHPHDRAMRRRGSRRRAAYRPRAPSGESPRGSSESPCPSRSGASTVSRSARAGMTCLRVTALPAMPCTSSGTGLLAGDPIGDPIAPDGRHARLIDAQRDSVEAMMASSPWIEDGRRSETRSRDSR